MVEMQFIEEMHGHLDREFPESVLKAWKTIDLEYATILYQAFVLNASHREIAEYHGTTVNRIRYKKRMALEEIKRAILE